MKIDSDQVRKSAETNLKLKNSKIQRLGDGRDEKVKVNWTVDGLIEKKNSANRWSTLKPGVVELPWQGVSRRYF